MLNAKCNIEKSIQRFSAAFRYSLVIATLVALAAPSRLFAFNAASANLIVNGDFSANAAQYINAPGYSTQPNPAAPAYWNNRNNINAGINGRDTTTGNPFSPGNSSGVRDFSFLQSSGTAISQTVKTYAGAAYTLSYDAGARGSDVPSNHDGLKVRIADAITGKRIAVAIPAVTQSAFHTFTLHFAAISNSTTVEFLNNNPASAFPGGTVDVSNVMLVPSSGVPTAAAVAYEYSPIGLTVNQINHRADALLRRMTLTEKIQLLSGLHGVPRLGVPPIRWSDATNGVVDCGPSTAYPAASCLSAAWSRKLARLEGLHIGLDARARQVNILLGPGVNILRQPQNGRSMEYIGGEDPFLAAQLVVPYVQGLQSEDVAACVKHYIGNEIETMRPWINCIISRRALEEIYLPPFRAAVRQGHAWTLMTAANWVNGHYAGANAFTLNTVLRRQWGFKGMVMTDWCGAYNTLHSLRAGLNEEMPAANAYSIANITGLLMQHKIAIDLINQRDRQILRMIVAMGFNDPKNPFAHRPADTSADGAVVNQVAAEGTVLLKNRNHLLPLNPSGNLNVVFIGPWATRTITGGGGSSHVTPSVTPVSLFNAVKKVAGANTHLAAIPWNDAYKRLWGKGLLTTPEGKPGVVADYYANGGFGGKPHRIIQSNISLNPQASVSGRSADVGAGDRAANLMQAVTRLTRQAGIGRQPISVVWKAAIHPPAAGLYSFVCAVNGSGEVYLNGRRIIDLWLPTWQNPVQPLKGALTTLRLRAGQTYQVRVVYRSLGGKPAIMGFGWMPRKSIHLFTADQRGLIRRAGVVIACMGFNQTIQREQADRPYNLTGPQNEYLRDAASLNPHTIAVIYAGAGVGMEKWIHHVGGLLWGWYPGQTGNISIAKIIFGRINPSGHLPDSFSRYWRNEAAYHHFPGYPGVFNHRWQAEPAYAGFPSGVGSRCNFVEGIYVGYRWYDYRHIRPLFPFGFGLSYTTFSLSHLQVTSRGDGRHRFITARVTITNTGHRAGAQVVQLYVHPPQGGPGRRVIQKLEGFKRVRLPAGQSRRVAIHLTWKAFANFHNRSDQWEISPGIYTIGVGTSSRQEPLQGTVIW